MQDSQYLAARRHIRAMQVWCHSRVRGVCLLRRTSRNQLVDTDLSSRGPVSNSGLIMFAHVLRLIGNQSCHAFSGGDPRFPVDGIGDARFPVDGIFASLTHHTFRPTLSSRAPAEGFSAFAVVVFASSSSASRVSVAAALPVDCAPSVGLGGCTSNPGRGGGNACRRQPLDHFLQTHFLFLKLLLLLHRDRSLQRDPLVLQQRLGSSPAKGFESVFIVFDTVDSGVFTQQVRWIILSTVSSGTTTPPERQTRPSMC